MAFEQTSQLMSKQHRKLQRHSGTYEKVNRTEQTAHQLVSAKSIRSSFISIEKATASLTNDWLAINEKTNVYLHAQRNEYELIVWTCSTTPQVLGCS